MLEFHLKFDWTRRLPWRLSVLAFTGDEALSRRILSESVAEFDPQAIELRMKHQPLTLHILAGPLRKQLDAFLAGVDPEALPDFFFAGCFRFVQITERVFEAARSIVKRRCPPNSSAPLISCFHRLHMFETDVALNSKILVEVAECMDKTRDLRQLIDLLGIATHPDIFTRDPKKHQGHLIKLLNRIIYRVDKTSHFYDIGHFKAENEKASRKAKELGEKIAQ